MKKWYRPRKPRPRRTDVERISWLQAQLDKATYTGRVEFRWSWTGRGWRLHETLRADASISVRDAIDRAMDEDEG